MTETSVLYAVIVTPYTKSNCFSDQYFACVNREPRVQLYHVCYCLRIFKPTLSKTKFDDNVAMVLVSCPGILAVNYQSVRKTFPINGKYQKCYNMSFNTQCTYSFLT